jgi:hypothetical protein
LSRIEKQAFAETGLIELVIPASIELLDEDCFLRCGSLTSLTFETGSKLSRIEKYTLQDSSLIELVIPASVELLGDGCLYECRSLFSVAFKSGSKLLRNEMEVRREAGWVGKAK